MPVEIYIVSHMNTAANKPAPSHTEMMTVANRVAAHVAKFPRGIQRGDLYALVMHLCEERDFDVVINLLAEMGFVSLDGRQRISPSRKLRGLAA